MQFGCQQADSASQILINTARPTEHMLRLLYSKLHTPPPPTPPAGNYADCMTLDTSCMHRTSLCLLRNVGVKINAGLLGEMICVPGTCCTFLEVMRHIASVQPQGRGERRPGLPTVTATSLVYVHLRCLK